MMTKNKDWQDEVALQRYTMITPLLSEDLDNAKRIAMREKIAQDNLTTARSLYRYEKAYRENGFQGLRPTDRQKRRSQIPSGPCCFVQEHLTDATLITVLSTSQSN